MSKRSILITCILVIATFFTTFSQEKFNVLVYTSPDRWHNPVIPTAITEFRKMSDKHFFGMNWTQQPSYFNADSLEKYSVIVFLQANGESLNAEQMESLKNFMRQGKGFVGIHAASTGENQDEWFRKLVGRTFIAHPEKQTAVLNVEDKSFPACMHLPDKWIWTDEWYEFGEPLTNKMNILLTVDEATYVAKRMVDGKEIGGMGDFHPIAWYQEYDGGRSFYTALGHLAIHYTDSKFLDHIYGGIYWAATGRGIVK